MTGGCNRTGDRGWNLKQFQIEKHALAGGNELAHDRWAFCSEQLKTDLVERSRLPQLLHKTHRGMATLEVQRDDNAAIGIHGHFMRAAYANDAQR